MAQPPIAVRREQREIALSLVSETPIAVAASKGTKGVTLIANPRGLQGEKGDQGDPGEQGVGFLTTNPASDGLVIIGDEIRLSIETLTNAL